MTVPADGGLSKKGGPRAWWAVGAAAVLVAAVIIGTLVLTDDNDKEVAASDQSTTTSSSSTSSTSTTSTTVSGSSTTLPTDDTVPVDSTSTTEAELDTSTVVFPDPASADRFTDPAAAAEAFATSFVGFVEPVVGEFVAGPDGAGVVEVRPDADGPVTTVALVQLADGNYWVQQATTDMIVLDEPNPGATISSPVTLRGSAFAFEGTVGTAVRQNGSAAPLGEGFVTGGGTEMAPFEGTLEFTEPTATEGALVLTTESAEDGTVREALVIKVGFG